MAGPHTISTELTHYQLLEISGGPAFWRGDLLKATDLVDPAPGDWFALSTAEGDWFAGEVHSVDDDGVALLAIRTPDAVLPTSEADALPWVDPFDGSRYPDCQPHDMLMFSPRPLTSGKHDHDPLPWRNGYDDTRWKDNWSDWDGLVYEPRPDRDNHNPILTAFRQREDSRNVYAVRQWLGFLNAWDDTIRPATPVQVKHARRVLTKHLATLATSPGGRDLMTATIPTPVSARTRRATALFLKWMQAGAAVRETFADTPAEARAARTEQAAFERLVACIDGTELDGSHLDPRGSVEDDPARGPRPS